jgi:flotillin
MTTLSPAPEPSLQPARIRTVERPRETGGWRSGRPVEDPAKIRRWGLVAARPSEYLVHVRHGRVRTRSSGQGAVCFKLPWDSVAVIPTSLQQLRFRADQVTLEKVGLEVTGLAVYRIAAPLVAFRVLNFSFPERAQEKLEETLSAMFVGAARRLIANLTLDECMQRRKSALAEELLREIAPVVGGTGSPEDPASEGWGVVIDTIEVQEVRVLSDAVFAQLQAPYRAALDRQAREARAEAEKEVTAREAACEQAIEEARLTAALAVSEKRKDTELREAEIRREQALQRARIERELEAKALEEEVAHKRQRGLAELAELEERSRHKLRADALRREEAGSDLATHAALLEAATRRAELERVELEAALERRRAELAVARAEGEAGAEVALRAAEARARSVESEARLEVARRLPDLAHAVGQRIGEVRITSIGEQASPFAMVAQAVSSVVDLVKTA